MRGLQEGLLRTWLPLLWVSASSLGYCPCHVIVICLCPLPHLRRKSSLPQVAKIRPAEASHSSAGKSQGLSGRRKAKWVIRGSPAVGPHVQTQAVQGVLPGMGVDPGDSATYWRNCGEEPRLQAGGGESVKTGSFWELFPGRLHPEEGKGLQEPPGRVPCSCFNRRD